MKRFLIVLVGLTLFWMGGEFGTVPKTSELKQDRWFMNDSGIFIWEGASIYPTDPGGWTLFVPHTRILRITDDLTKKQPVSDL